MINTIKYLIKYISVKHTNNVIVIHTMGKVGSSSVYKSLKHKNISNVFHTHFLNEERYYQQLKSMKNKGIKIRNHLKESMILIKNKKYIKNIYVITVIRDPIERNLSAYFENINELCIQGDTEKIDNISIEKVTKKFFDNYPHYVPLIWLDKEIRDVFNIDVFQEQFNVEKGYSIMKYGKVKLLILRMDMLNETLEPALDEFLKLRNVKIKNTNLGENKYYAKVYEEFKKSIEIPDEYILQMYNSKYSKHFFSSTELDLLRDKWLNKNK